MSTLDRGWFLHSVFHTQPNGHETNISRVTFFYFMPHCALLEHLVESRTLKHLLEHSVFGNKQVHSKFISMLSSPHLTAHAYIQIQIKACWLNISSTGLNRQLNALTMHSRAWPLDVLPPIRKNLWKVWVISPFVGAYHHPREPFFYYMFLVGSES